MRISSPFLTLIFAALLLTACASGSAVRDEGDYATLGRIERLDPRLDALLDVDQPIQILAEGHKWTEGPVWVQDGRFLLYSDIPRNSVYKWKAGEGATVYLKPAGYTGSEPRGGESGSNGLVLDPAGRLILCQHGDRRMARMEAPLSDPRPQFTTLVSHHLGKRLNSPNDAVYHSDGSLYFTDPPYGLEGNVNDPARELDFQGVYRLAPDGALTLLTKEMTRPNGIAFSPDEKTLYVANSDPKQAVWVAFDVKRDGAIENGRVLYDATDRVGKQPGLPDGMAVDRKGNLWATGPGGVLIFAPDGALLGRIDTTQPTANCTLAPDGTLYITANTYLVRVKTKARPIRR